MFTFSMLLTILYIMVGVAYLILSEWKLLSYIQLQKGPNKFGFIGILQTFSDAIKLFKKKHSMPLILNYMIYNMSPIVCVFTSFMLWPNYPFLFFAVRLILVSYFFPLLLE